MEVLTLRTDKRKHLVFGAVAAAWALVLVWLISVLGWQIAPAFMGVTLGVTYELLQKYLRNGTPSWADAAATSAPGIATTASLYVLY